jgi:phage tail-like protein
MVQRPGILTQFALPLPAFRYLVLLRDSAGLLDTKANIGAALAALGGGFTECSGIEIATEVLDYTEGGQNKFVRRLPTRTKPADIVLKRGLLIATDLWVWIRKVSDGIYQRKDGIIVLLTNGGIPAQAWMFRQGLPLKWSGPTLQAAQSGVATETLTIAHEGLDYFGLSSFGL